MTKQLPMSLPGTHFFDDNTEVTKYMEYKTRGGSLPNNKPNVYFMAHPDDFILYFNTITEEIHRVINCAIWYIESSRSIDDEKHQANLNQMQLFVVPVTSRFLSCPSIALDEFRYAIEKHIPVLPIAVESGLDTQFSSVCGNIQFLDKTNMDVTAISYENKLSRFLLSVLIDDVMAEKIRNAFDAYIFLSYRKIDRAHAQKLMKLIHQNNVCRDIAIWYDEFLILGQDFNLAIKEAMQRCDVFVLVVTQNLLKKDKDGKDNYVQRIEYPRANNTKKPIVPFEMEKTDHQELEIKFPGLKECIKPDGPIVSRYMSELISSLAITPKTRNSVHNFFIGLAYLNGMDLEKDTAKAITLISEAAEEGLPEAMEEMVTLYREANGVDRDYNKALEWQSRYVAKLKEITVDDPSMQNEIRLFGAVTVLISFYMEQGFYDEARSQNEELNRRGMHVHELYGDSSILLYSLYMRPKIEQGLESLGKNKVSPQSLYLECCDFCRKQYQENKAQLALQTLAQSYLELGRITYFAYQFTLAREYLEMCIGYCWLLCEDQTQYVYREVLAVALSEHARVESLLNQIDIAKNDCDEAITIEEALYSEHQTPDMCECLADLYARLGDVLVKCNELEKAEKHYTRAEELYNYYKHQTMSSYADSGIINLYDSMAELYARKEHTSLAYEYYRREEELANALISNNEEVDISLTRWSIYIGRGALQEKESHITEALNLYLEAYKLTEDITDKNHGLKKVGKYTQYATIVTIYEFAKRNNLSAYIKQYRHLLLKLPSVISVPKTAVLKELWKNDPTHKAVSYNMLSTYGELMGDIYCWSFEDNRFLGIHLTPILRWLRNSILIWRIPFYPLLSLIFLFICHAVSGYSDFAELCICYTDCLVGQITYQSTASLLLGVVFLVTSGCKSLKRKRLTNIAAALAILCISIYLCIVLFGVENLTPDIMHTYFLLFPLYSAGVGCAVTKIVYSFLKRSSGSS